MLLERDLTPPPARPLRLGEGFVKRISPPLLEERPASALLAPPGANRRFACKHGPGGRDQACHWDILSGRCRGVRSSLREYNMRN